MELIEESVHLLRTAPVVVLATYYLGAAPFVLGLLFFWADLSRSPFASQHLAEESLGVASLFLWMKCCHTVFAGKLSAHLSGESAPALTPRQCARILSVQTLLQSTGLIVLPIALVILLPFGWVYAFYQNLTVLGLSTPGGARELLKESRRQATLWPRQNHALLVALSGFGLCVFLNWMSVGLILPGLVKMLFGLQSSFSRSGLNLLNSTFFATIVALTYLCVDPLLKAAYTLRCFYGQAVESGDDLKAELRGLALPAGGAVVAMMVVVGSCAWTNMPRLAEQGETFDGAPGYKHVAPNGAGTAEFLARVDEDDASSGPSSQPARGSGASAALDATESAGGAQREGRFSPPELDRSIERVIQQDKYTWRMPREKIESAAPEQRGVIGRFLDSALKLMSHWFQAAVEWLGKWLRKLFTRPSPDGPRSSGYGWILGLEILLYTLLAAVVVGLAVLAIRLLQARRKAPAHIASLAMPATPDLSDEGLGAEQLPESGWAELGQELLRRGEFRLALRAFYLASLANLADRNLISLARFKSNRDYERELRRRGHTFPELLQVFSENLSTFERSWYGLHEVGSELVNQFAANVERLKGSA
jgi:hypothetical protein